MAKRVYHVFRVFHACSVEQPCFCRYYIYRTASMKFTHGCSIVDGVHHPSMNFGIWNPEVDWLAIRTNTKNTYIIGIEFVNALCYT